PDKPIALRATNPIDRVRFLECCIKRSLLKVS
ncbi:MAG: hypothetical protein ACI9HK_001063, partial [Pirellulaceae bacterium]